MLRATISNEIASHPSCHFHPILFVLFAVRQSTRLPGIDTQIDTQDTCQMRLCMTPAPMPPTLRQATVIVNVTATANVSMARSRGRSGLAIGER
jgi:hypothetical protein